jgi:hypothetical protein
MQALRYGVILFCTGALLAPASFGQRPGSIVIEEDLARDARQALIGQKCNGWATAPSYLFNIGVGAVIGGAIGYWIWLEKRPLMNLPEPLLIFGGFGAFLGFAGASSEHTTKERSCKVLWQEKIDRQDKIAKQKQHLDTTEIFPMITLPLGKGSEFADLLSYVSESSIEIYNADVPTLNHEIYFKLIRWLKRAKKKAIESAVEKDSAMPSLLSTEDEEILSTQEIESESIFQSLAPDTQAVIGALIELKTKRLFAEER